MADTCLQQSRGKFSAIEKVFAEVSVENFKTLPDQKWFSVWHSFVFILLYILKAQIPRIAGSSLNAATRKCPLYMCASVLYISAQVYAIYAHKWTLSMRAIRRLCMSPSAAGWPCTGGSQCIFRKKPPPPPPRNAITLVIFTKDKSLSYTNDSSEKHKVKSDRT